MEKVTSLAQIVQSRKWDDPATVGSLPVETIVENINRRLLHQIQHSIPSYVPAEKRLDSLLFTKLQEKVFNDDKFWGKWDGFDHYTGKNLVIQGATSAGKTLLSEMLLVDLVAHDRSALVLVPLKSMVRERYTRFKKDFSVSKKIRVYASSSDYMDHDEALMDGDFEIAIMVYEKFFAMLCQPDCHLMDRCQLIVVDELSMLQVNDRGPRLEIAINKAMDRPNPPRIVCLATVDCNTENVRRWLSNGKRGEAVNLSEGSRPVSLNEYLVQEDGTYSMYHVSGGEANDKEDDRQPDRGQLPVTQLPDGSDWDKRTAVLRAVLKKLYPGAEPQKERNLPKTLVFVPTQNGVRKIARFIAGMHLPLNENQEGQDTDNKQILALKDRLKHCDMDQDLKLMKGLLSDGISFHHGSMSTNLRETVEELFTVDPSCKIIVATATLTIGVNLPLDVVILFDTKIPDGTSKKKPITLQEYRNFIGRAGRLGLSRNQAESYLIAMNRDEASYWYRRNRMLEPIGSALIGCKEEELAPYYLNLLTGDRNSFTVQKVQDIYNQSLSRICSESVQFSPERLVQKLEVYKLLNRPKQREKLLPDEEKSYSLNFFGIKLAPYAFTLPTTYMLRMDFVQPGGHNETIGLISQLTGKIDSDQYLPDILYCICQNSEIAESSNLKLREDRDLSADLRTKQMLLKSLRVILGRPIPGATEGSEEQMVVPEQPCETWNGSELEEIFLSNCNDPPSQENYSALYRTLIIYYWTKGFSAEQIQKKLGISAHFSNGDIERLAEVIGFQVDAVYHIIQERTDLRDGLIPDNFQGAVRRLSNRIKYGMPGELVIFANRHVHGLDRSAILALGRAAQKVGKEPLDYLRTVDEESLLKATHISFSIQNLLLQRLQYRFSNSSDEKLNELDVTVKFKTGLRQLRDFSSKNPKELFELMKQLFQICTRDTGEELFFDCAQIKEVDENNPNTAYWKFLIEQDSPPRFLQISYCYQDNESEPSALSLRKIPNNNPSINQSPICRIVLFNGDRCPSISNFRSQVHGSAPDLGLTCSNLANLIAASIPLGKKAKKGNAASLLYQVLSDAAGFQNALPFSWLNYQNPEHDKDWGKVRYQLLMNSDDPLDNEVKQELLQDKKLSNFFLLPWKKELSEQEKEWLCQEPVIILLDSKTMRMHRSLMTMLDLIQQNNRERDCLVLVREPSDQQDWARANSTGMVGLSWKGYPKIQTAWYATVTEKLSAIRVFLKLCEDRREHGKFTIGVSYPHYDQNKAMLGQDSRLDTDNSCLHALAQDLNICIGEENILYDQNARARTLFHGDPEPALNAYQKCSVGIALCNMWGVNNSWCQKERERLKKGGAKIFYLGTNTTPDLIDGETDRIIEPMPTDENQRRQLVDDIKTVLMELMDKEGDE